MDKVLGIINVWSSGILTAAGFEALFNSRYVVTGLLLGVALIGIIVGILLIKGDK